MINVRKIAKYSLKKVLSLVPDDIAGPIALHFAQRDNFSDKFGPTLIASLAPRLGICGIVADGVMGRVISAPNDRVVFAHYARNRTWAESTNRLFFDFFSGRKSGTYLDIGANIGLTLLRVATLKDIVCIALEPEPRNFANLTMNARLNGIHNNIILHQLAAFDRETNLEMTRSDYNLGDHRLRLDSEGSDPQVFSVKAIPLDKLFCNLTRPIAVKIDTQGAEPFVIKGARDVLSQTDLLLLEWYPAGMRAMGGNPEETIAFLRENFARGYIWSQGDSSDPVPRPTAEICDEMLQLNDRWSATKNYTDVALFRD